MTDAELVDHVDLIAAVLAGYPQSIARRDAEISCKAIRAALSAQPVAGEVAWECPEGFIRYITQTKYEKLSQEHQRHYKPYRCSNCAPSTPPHAVVEAVPLEWHLDADAAETLKQTIGDDDTVSEITLSVCDGHEGPGLYVWLTEYPEEGSLLLRGIAPKAAQEKT